MDPFEAATQFSQILRSLTPSSLALIRAAHFALKYCHHEDYLFPSIMGIAGDDTVELNTKAVLFQFVEVLLNELVYYLRQPKFNYPYVENIRQLLPQLVLHVLPGSTSTNLFLVFTGLKHMSALLKFQCSEFIEKYQSSHPSDEDSALAAANEPFPEIEVCPDGTDLVTAAWELLIRKKKQSQYERRRLCEHEAVQADPVSEQGLFNIKLKGDPNTQLFTKRQMIARMEDDRESHKRSKETLWLVNRPKDATHITEDEFLEQYWEKIPAMTGETNSTLLGALEELNGLAAASYKDTQEC